jgi:hypothetical protein
MKYEYENGYENHQVINPTKINLAELKTDKDVIVTYAKLSEARHFQDSKATYPDHKPYEKTHGQIAADLEVQIVDDVRIRLEKAGWHVHIFANDSVHGNCNVEMYLHAFAGMPEVSEVPFSNNSNLELTETELFKEDGSLRSKEETLSLLKERVGEPTLNLKTMLDENEIDEETKNIVDGIMAAENLTELHELDEGNRTMRSGEKEFTWRRSETEAQEEAQEYLDDDDELWKMAVEAGSTTLGKDDWNEMVIDNDGWESLLCHYDGTSNTLDDENGTVYWRTN